MPAGYKNKLKQQYGKKYPTNKKRRNNAIYGTLAKIGANKSRRKKR